MLAVALDRYVQVEVEPAPALLGPQHRGGRRPFRRRVAPGGAGRGRRLGARPLRRDRALADSGVAGSGIVGRPGRSGRRRRPGPTDPLAVAAAYDGHPENAAASVFGGLVAATMVEPRRWLRPLALEREWPLSPSCPIARWPPLTPGGCCRTSVSRVDATFNLGRMGLLLAGLAEPLCSLRPPPADRLHQDARDDPVPRGSGPAGGVGGGRCAGVVLVWGRTDALGYHHPDLGWPA